MKNNEKFTVLRAEKRHLSGIARLEELCFAHPWTEKGLETLTGGDGVAFCALTEDGQVVSYAGMVFSLDEGEITDIATHPDFRRAGLARAVTEALFGFCAEKGIKKIFLEVRESNVGAIALYTSLGFGAVGKRPNFYRTPTEAAIIMTKEIQE